MSRMKKSMGDIPYFPVRVYLENRVFDPDLWIVAVFPAENETGEIDLQIGQSRNDEVLVHDGHPLEVGRVVRHHHNLKRRQKFRIDIPGDNAINQISC